MTAAPFLNRAGRRKIAKQAKVQAKALSSGTLKVDARTDQRIIDMTTQIAVQKYGPERLSPEHKEAIVYMAGRMTHMVTGHARNIFGKDTDEPLRLAYSLACGAGKTLTAQSWMAAVHFSGRPYSVAYAAAEVEALCEIKRNLTTDFGIPADRIGLLHSFPCDPEKAKAGLSGFASEPSTPEKELHTKQFLLVTHSLVQTGEAALARYNTYGPLKSPRSIILHDESLLVSSSWSMSIKNVDRAVHHLKTELEYEPKFDNRPPPIEAKTQPQAGYRIAILRYAQDCLAKLKATQDSVIRFPSFEDYSDDINADQAIGHLPTKTPGTLRLLLQGSNREVRVHHAGGRAAAWFVLCVPDELNNVFVLDASYMLRTLGRLKDTNLEPDEKAPKQSIDYSQVSIETFQHQAGRGSIEEECLKPRSQRTLARKVATWIKTLPESDPILVFTFKRGDKSDSPDIPAKLLETLEHQGVDLSRIRIVTHGRARGSNGFENYRHVAWYGVFEPPRVATAGAMLGEKRDLKAALDHDLVQEVHRREILHELYQEGSRSHARHIINGKAGDAHFFLPIWNQGVVAELVDEGAMPGAQVIYRDDLEADAAKAMRDTETAKATQAILEVLGGLPADQTKIGGQTLKPLVDQGRDAPVSADVWSKTIAALKNSPKLAEAGWRREARSFVRN